MPKNMSVLVGIGLVWLITLGVWFVTAGRHRQQRIALIARLRLAGQKLAASEQARQNLLDQLDSLRLELEKLRKKQLDGLRSTDLVPATSAVPARPALAAAELSVNGTRLSGNGFEDTQIMRP